jgi:hypothetical protein
VDGLPPVTDAKSGMAAVLHILMKHMADCLHLVLDSVVEKYALDKEEVMRVITESPRWKELPVNPLIHDLGYALPGSELAAAEPAAVKEEPAAATAAPAANVCPEIEDTAMLMKEIDEVLAATPTPAQAAPKKRVVIKKVKPATPVPAPAEAAAEVTPAPVEPPADAVATAAPAEAVVAAPPPVPPKKKIAVTRVKKSEAPKPASP